MPVTGLISTRRDMGRVAAATVIGTAIEWYDFFLYASAAGLIFSKLFFQPAGQEFAPVVSFATVAVSFLFRPIGAFIAGHFGDIIGRKAMLVVTLFLMGGATAAIGLLPTYKEIGIAAPIILILIRILQGLSTGGEWGGAILMAVEHAPDNQRGRMGAFPQMGVPIGMLLASGVLALMTGVISPNEQFEAWGWRVPFLLSLVLVVVGFVVRHSVDESPVFAEIKEQAAKSSVPVVQLFKRHALLVLLAAVTFAGNITAGYMTTGGFIQKYTTNDLHMDRTYILIAIAIGSFCWLITTWVSGILSDKIGRRGTYVIGWIALVAVIFVLFPMINTKDVVILVIALALYSIGLGFTYGPQSAFFAEMFPASIRYTGVSMAYTLGAIMGGFSPMIAELLLKTFKDSSFIAFYVAAVAVLGFIATLLIRDRKGIPLGHSHEEEQERGHFVWSKA